MQIELSRRNFMKAVAATGAAAALTKVDAVAAILEDRNQTVLEMLSTNGEVVGSTVKISHTIVGENYVFDVGQFDIIKTGTVNAARLRFMGHTFTMSLRGFHNVTAGDSAMISGVGFRID